MSIGGRGATTGVTTGATWMLVTPPLGISFLSFGAGITSGRVPGTIGAPGALMTGEEPQLPVAQPVSQAVSQQPFLPNRPFSRAKRPGLPQPSSQAEAQLPQVGAAQTGAHVGAQVGAQIGAGRQ